MTGQLILENISKKYLVEGTEVRAVDNVSLSIKKRESVSFVGPSGCGKTTLMRIISGLEQASEGKVTFAGKVITTPIPDIMMIFQTYALMPWKTVQENVELALLDKPIEERAKIASQFIELVGLEGFANSYPRELSGGMKQRVGIARAICREPGILLLDEPFSALDPFTANNLRTEVLRFYLDKVRKPDIMILVTHNIEEAVQMSDRVIVFSNRPAHIVADIKIDLPFPRNRRDEMFNQYVDKITSLIT